MIRFRAPISAAALALVVSACSDQSPVRPDVSRPGSPTAAVSGGAAMSAEAAATEISRTIQQRHWPHRTLLNPRYASGDPASPDFWTLAPVAYTQAADNAVWTGHYLAAEAFRYAETHEDAALRNVRRAVAGFTALIDVTKTDLLARFLIPRTASHADGVLAEEAHHGIYEATYAGLPHAWLGNTSRDQYSGAFFGLGVAYDLVDDAGVRAEIKSDVNRMLTFLTRNGWSVRMPNGSTSTTFVGRADQQLSFLQVGRRVDPGRWDAVYKASRSSLAGSVKLPIQLECSDVHGSYYKFNLDHINLYNLIRLEEAGSYRNSYLSAFATLRNCTRTHGNAHFNMIERGLLGAAPTRDGETAALLTAWRGRPRRDVRVDNTGKYAACGTNRACSPIPVADRPTTDFLWQRSPFLLTGGKLGTIAAPGVDYILPYWMARHYDVAVD